MKKYNVTVNGVTYEVTVEEADSDTAGQAAPAPSTPAAPKAAPKTAPKSAASAGGTKVTSPMPGTILRMNVKVGDTVKKDDLVCVLEAMKMENEIFASEGGVVKSIDAPAGSSVNAGDAIVTLG